jgi:hypothetical protein
MEMKLLDEFMLLSHSKLVNTLFNSEYRFMQAQKIDLAPRKNLLVETTPADYIVYVTGSQCGSAIVAESMVLVPSE